MTAFESDALRDLRTCHQPVRSRKHDQGEQRTRIVMALTAVTMVAEILAGSWYGSMALLADGWHMGTHVAAFGITLFAYHYAKKHADNPAFSFGTGKVTVLGGFASAVALGVVAFMMVIESVERLFSPHEIGFQESIVVAIVGLIVNLASAWLLKDHHHHHGHSHGHSHHSHSHHSHSHDDHVHHDGSHGHAHHHSEHSHSHNHHSHQHADQNLKAAYMHVLADALTSVLAIVALIAAMSLGWLWLDALMGVVGAAIISVWALGLMKDSSRILLDAGVPESLYGKVTDLLVDAGVGVRDLHIWPVSEHQFALVLSIDESDERTVSSVRARLMEFSRIAHVTIEVELVK